MITLIDGVSATTSNSGTNVLDVSGEFQDKQMRFQVTISNTATVQIYVSNDNTNWVSVSSKTSSGVYENIVWSYVKADVTAYTSGTITCTLTL